MLSSMGICWFANESFGTGIAKDMPAVDQKPKGLAYITIIDPLFLQKD
jgi:hypothetical protein